MKVRIGNKEAVSASDEAIMIIFNDDDERLHIINLLQGMTPREGVRILAEFPNLLSLEERNTILEAEAKKHNT